MDGLHKRFLDEIVESEKLWNSADYLVYITLPVVKDPKLLVRALENVHKSVVLCVSNILKFEYLYRHIELSSDADKNLDIFFKKCAGKFGLSQEACEKIKEIMFLGKKHKKSGFEFSRSGKIVILDDKLRIHELRVDNMKEFLKTSKKLIEGAKSSFGLVS